MQRKKQFFRWNQSASQRIDQMLGIAWESIRDDEARLVESLVFPGAVVADVGGGKKPFFSVKNKRLGTYVGLDINPDELKLAPEGSYDRVEVCDITHPPDQLLGQFDVIICNNTLEHILDAEQGLQGLYDILKPGGTCYVAVPCRLAPFAWLNRWLPEGLKKSLLHALIPKKSSDGFKAYYDKATPSLYERMMRELGAEILYEKRFYWSSYFTVFVPAFLLWRTYSVVARSVSPDYCERFHLAFKRPLEEMRPAPGQTNPDVPTDGPGVDSVTDRHRARSDVAEID